MKLEIASLAIGIGIGIVIAAVAIVVFVVQPGAVILDNAKVLASVAANNRTHFFMSGLVKEISKDEMIIDQTFGNPEYNDNPAVKIKMDRGAAFVSCRGTGVLGESCKDSVIARIDEGLNVCTLTRTYNGEFYAGKIWADSGCGPFGLVNTDE